MMFWLGLACGLAIETLAIWLLCVWSEHHERKELNASLPEARTFIEINGERRPINEF